MLADVEADGGGSGDEFAASFVTSTTFFIAAVSPENPLLPFQEEAVATFNHLFTLCQAKP